MGTLRDVDPLEFLWPIGHALFLQAPDKLHNILPFPCFPNETKMKWKEQVHTFSHQSVEKLCF